ncbi:hypothetical protein [Hymenobacter glacieicola]|nr:hypothetical protein [Hymenobacter glacieicola]
MFANYEIDFAKLNLNWLHSVSIELDEITNLLEVAERAHTYLQVNGQIEMVGYTNRRKFISVIFTINGPKLVVHDVELPRYETIQDVILRRLAEEPDQPLDEREDF